MLLVSSELCPSALFPFADVALYPFVVKDLCHEYNYMLSLEPGGGLGDPDTNVIDQERKHKSENRIW